MEIYLHQQSLAEFVLHVGELANHSQLNTIGGIQMEIEDLKPQAVIYRETRDLQRLYLVCLDIIDALTNEVKPEEKEKLESYYQQLRKLWLGYLYEQKNLLALMGAPKMYNICFKKCCEVMEYLGI